MKPSAALILGGLVTLALGSALWLQISSRDEINQASDARPAGTQNLISSVVTTAPASEGTSNEDDPIRSFAEEMAAPVYPATAIAQQLTGVVVAMIHLDTTRHVEQIDILDSPSADISTAVRAALLKWRFRGQAADPPGLRLAGKKLTGTVTFYFFRANGGYKVAGPKDAPNIKDHNAGS